MEMMVQSVMREPQPTTNYYEDEPITNNTYNDTLKVLQTLKTMFISKSKVYSNLAMLVICNVETLGSHENVFTCKDGSVQITIRQAPSSPYTLVAKHFKTIPHYIHNWQHANGFFVNIETHANSISVSPEIWWIVRPLSCSSHWKPLNQWVSLKDPHPKIQLSDIWDDIFALKKLIIEKYYPDEQPPNYFYNVNLVVSPKWTNDKFRIMENKSFFMPFDKKNQHFVIQGIMCDEAYESAKNDILLNPRSFFCTLFQKYKMVVNPNFMMHKTNSTFKAKVLQIEVSCS